MPLAYTILAIHLYDKNILQALFVKLRPLLGIANELWVSSPDENLLAYAKQLGVLFVNDVRLYSVNNRWHDWSGYLAFLSNARPNVCLIICNDSIVTRRVISGRTMARFVSSLYLKEQFMVGELDTSAMSVDLNGWTSTSWIATYLFAISGFVVDAHKLEVSVINDVRDASSNPSHYFCQYLTKRRSSYVRNSEILQAKLGAMFLERRLTRLAIESGVPILNYCAGSKFRKLEHLFERFL